MIRKFSRDELESEPHSVLFKDLYPWDAIDDTPFGASLAIVQPGGRTMLHSHDPAETFVICRGAGTMSIDQKTTTVGPGDVIYLPPGSVHDLRNDSTTDELVFVSVFWSARIDIKIDPTPRLIVPSPPSSNGPLHLGHLSGPYLLADVMRRYYRARGIPATLVCLTDDHQTYVVERARRDGRPVAETATLFGEQAVQTLAQFHADPDVRVFTSRDQDYQAAVRTRFAQLVDAGKLELRELDTLYCEGCKLTLYDGYVFGKCPRCGEGSFGFTCDVCCFPNNSSDLTDAVCDRCEQPPVVRKVRRYVFPIQPYIAQLAEYHHGLRLSPKLRRLAAQFLELDLAPAATQVGDWGISVEDGQIIAPWFEVALAGPYLRDRYAPASHQLCFFGYDNAYLYLVHDPAIVLALGGVPPSGLAANEFLLLENAKMSTSRSHALDAGEVLSRVPADLVRLYLAKIRPEDARTSSSVTAATMFLNMVTQYWQGWLARLGQMVASETAGRAPAPANASLAPWSSEQAQFLNVLKSLVARAREGYEGFSLKDVTSAIFELVDRGASFGVAQSHLAGIASLAGQRATGLALELAAARTLAMIVAPVMPAFATQLWGCLGYTGPIAWDDDVAPIPAGQPIDLAHRFFPSPIELG